MSTRVGVLAFRMGETADAALSDSEIEFYEAVGTLLVGDRRCSLARRNCVRTIPIPQSIVKELPTLFELATRFISELVNDADILLIDFANPPRPDLPIYTPVMGLSSALQESWWKTKSGQAFVLLSDAISDVDHALKPTKTQIEKERLAFIDGSGRVVGKIPAKSFDRSRYEAALKTVRDDPLMMLKRKMMRRIGHFRHGTGRNSFINKFYYDGTHCEEEIKELLQKLPSRPEQIILHAPISPWLRRAATGFQIQAGATLFDLSREDQNDDDLSWKSKVRGQPLVLVPLVDSGRTLLRINSALREANPECQPVYQAIMSTEEGTEEGTRLIGPPANPITVKYFLPVTQVRFSHDSIPPCAAGHQGSFFDFNFEPTTLTSYAFWSMIGETNFKEEEDVPKTTRNSLGFVPNFPQILLQNAPLLAKKIEHALKEAPGKLSVDPVLVCPDEVGAIELASCVRSVLRCSVIRVPRQIIDNIPQQLTMDLLEREVQRVPKDQEWFTQLKSVAGGRSTGAILIDEFAASGETLKRLRSLCTTIGITVERSVTLVDFQLGNLHTANPIVSLYTLPLGSFS